MRRRAPIARRRPARSPIGRGALVAGLLCGLAFGPVAGATAPSAAADNQQCEAGRVDWIASPPDAFAVLDPERAWQKARGVTSVIAVVDSGIDGSHPHLRDAIAPGSKDLVKDGTRPDGLTDLYRHGTVVAGVIAARELPESGLKGVAPRAKLISVRVFRDLGEDSARAGFQPTEARLAQGIKYAADRHATIINVSLSVDRPSPTLKDAVKYATARGSLVVASAGSRDTAAGSTDDGPRYPAAYKEVLGVAAGDDILNQDGVGNAIHGEHVDVAAPGRNVLSAFVGGGDCIFARDNKASSSWATAYASGAAALVAAAHPDETPEQWAYRLKATASRPDPDRRDDAVGWGMIRPYEAITFIPDSTKRGPADSPFADTSNTAIRPAAGTVQVSDAEPGFRTTRRYLTGVGIAGVALLAMLGTLLVLRRPRRPAPTTPDAPTPPGS